MLLKTKCLPSCDAVGSSVSSAHIGLFQGKHEYQARQDGENEETEKS